MVQRDRSFRTIQTSTGVNYAVSNHIFPIVITGWDRQPNDVPEDDIYVRPIRYNWAPVHNRTIATDDLIQYANLRSEQPTEFDPVPGDPTWGIDPTKNIYAYNQADFSPRYDPDLDSQRIPDGFVVTAFLRPFRNLNQLSDAVILPGASQAEKPILTFDVYVWPRVRFCGDDPNNPTP